MTELGFTTAAGEALGHAAADIARDTRLARPVIHDPAKGITAALSMMSEWFDETTARARVVG